MVAGVQLHEEFFTVPTQVSAERAELREALAAVLTLVRLGVGVSSLVTLQIEVTAEAFPTFITVIGLFTGMSSNVHLLIKNKVIRNKAIRKTFIDNCQFSYIIHTKTDHQCGLVVEHSLLM